MNPITSSSPVINLDGSWAFRFEEGKSIEESPGCDFVPTDTMTVPGCYDTMPRWFLKRGTGLYRRSFILDRPVDNAWLVVDGMGLRGHFEIDSRDLGIHPYPYARLELETGPLAAGAHILFAALDNRFDWATNKLVRQYYDFYFYGGFYHGVRLIFDNRKLFVRTRDFTTGEVEIEAVNFAERDFDATLLFDGCNEVSATFRNGRATVRVPDFRLWSPEEPNLHSLAVKLATGDSALVTRFGIRSVEARDRKIWLNGEPIFLKGVNRHEAHMEFGAATSEAQMLRDLQLIKGLGANFVRGAHYQQAPRFLDLCDELGILVWEESLGWGNGQPYTKCHDGIDELADPVFAEAQVRQTREMVRASINHPSVIIAGFLNECASNREECKALVERLVAAIRAEDAGRLVTFATNCGWFHDICNAETDILSFNTYPGTIPNQPGLPAELAAKVRDLDPHGEGTAGLNTVARHFRAQYPDKPIVVSECGCGALYGCHDPMASVGSEEFQEEYLTDILEAVRDNPDIVGYAIWQFADTRSYHRNSNRHNGKLFGISIAGIFTHDRQPKKAVETVRRFFTEMQ